jgi:hypothetical protein
MKIIAHRGNLEGPSPATENKPDTIDRAIALGFDVEIDVRYVNGAYYLGHDAPETLIPYSFLSERSDALWIHCKDLDSLVQLSGAFNCFYHDKDTYTITSRGYIWGNINSPTHPSVIQVLPERSGAVSLDCKGICTDYPIRYAMLSL